MGPIYFYLIITVIGSISLLSEYHPKYKDENHWAASEIKAKIMGWVFLIVGIFGIVRELIS